MSPKLSSPPSTESIEKRFRLQLTEAAQAGFAADNAVFGGGLPIAWNEVPAPRRRELILAAELIRTAYVENGLTCFDEAYRACNKHWFLKITHVFIGGVIGFYKAWQV